MPYDVTGYDSAGVLHTYEMTDDGTVSAHGDDALLSGWLGDNAFTTPEPVAGETAPASGDLTPSQLDALRQHISKLLTNVDIARHPDEAAPPPTGSAPPSTPAPAPTAPRYTQTQLEAMTVTDLRSMATSAQIAGASSMTKAELVTALLASQGA